MFQTRLKKIYSAFNSRKRPLINQRPFIDVPYGLELSNFLNGFQKLEILLFAMKGF